MIIKELNISVGLSQGFWVVFGVVTLVVCLIGSGLLKVANNYTKTRQYEAETSRYQFIIRVCDPDYLDVKRGYLQLYIFDNQEIDCQKIMKMKKLKDENTETSLL